ncbi:MAG: hypothetical protein AB7O21_05470 [Gammaproteobacteria bacterium]
MQWNSKPFLTLTAAVAALVATSVQADRGRPARAFDVCVDAATDARLTNFPPSAGDRVTAVGMLLPAGTLPSVDNPGDDTCAVFASKKIGTFWVNGTFVNTFDGTGKLPQAAADDLAYVQWHYRVDGVGTFETSGPIKQFVQGGTYPQVVTGGTGRFRGTKGEATNLMLGAGGFQIRTILPHD